MFLLGYVCRGGARAQPPSTAEVGDGARSLAVGERARIVAYPTLWRPTIGWRGVAYVPENANDTTPLHGYDYAAVWGAVSWALSFST